jgi:RNA polymerase sigma-70 factor (ECF subfamily)
MEGGHGMTDMSPEAIDTADTLDRLMVHQAKFLNFLSSRVDASAAEDILQSAYIKAMEHAGEIRDGESAVAWFYRILRNAITDSYRRQSVRTRAQDSFAAEAPTSYEPELEQTVCACIGDVIQDLRSEYRDAIQQVDLDGVSVQAFAASQGTSANNASVRLHRARKDLAKKLTSVCGACAEHKCLDCTCRRSQL